MVGKVKGLSRIILLFLVIKFYGEELHYKIN